jgi:hypothetical protein
MEFATFGLETQPYKQFAISKHYRIETSGIEGVRRIL